jgi:hypothetical protein
MESLESKLDRLSPEQRKEVEDFVEFLLSRSGQVYPPPDTSRTILPVLNIAPPPMSLIEPVHAGETRPVRLPDPAMSDDHAALVTRDETTSAPFQEIGGGVQDRINHDYIDYGKFETQSSPATEAVKKVRRKIIAREGQDKPRHLLDWVD